jgi:hypothetical protein
MTLYEFRLLTEDEQALTVWHGDFLMSRKIRNHTVLLYKVHDFYVEVYYDNECNDVSKLNPFSSRDRLKFYFQLQLN